MYMDGSSNSTGFDAGLILSDPKEIVAEYALYFKFPAINNEAKCKILAARLRIARELEIQNLKACNDS